MYSVKKLYKTASFPVENRCLIAQDQKQKNTWPAYLRTLQLQMLLVLAAVTADGCKWNL